MTDRLHLIVCYDVSDDRRRTRLFRGLRGFARHVQKSVFEGAIPGTRHAELLDLIESTIDLERDTVRVYHLCRACRARTELVGTASTVEHPDTDWVVR